MKLSKDEMFDLMKHSNHELVMDYIKGFGLILRCVDCNEQLLNFEEEE